MLFRAFVLGVLFASPAGLCFAQFPPTSQTASGYPGYEGSQGQMGQPPGRNAGIRNMNSIVGAVHSTDNQPLNNVRVDLRDGSTGAIVGSSYTGMGGNFEFRQLQAGPYDVTASSGTSRVEERVQVSSISTNVDLRLPVTTVPNDGIAGRTVSVNQYRVPESAREELRKAQQAAAKNKGEDEVAKHLDRALEIHPTYADALSMRAALKLDNKDVAGAIQDAQKAIETDANYPLAYTVMGSALNVQMKFDEALRSLERAASLSPDIWQTYFEIGRAYAGKKDYAKSLEALDRAQRLAPDYALIQLIRAHCLMGLGRYSDAVTELQAYLSKHPKDVRVEQARKMLAQAQAATGRASN
jgi:cytochrome c-type biogenesis protein CcmH/NrfG